MPDDVYRQLHHALKSFIPESRMATDPLRTLAYGTDASFYRLIPRIVVRADNEAEVAGILRQTGEKNIPVTFRAAGTSLSGQAISDSVLLVAGESWQQWEVLDGGKKIRLQPGIIGARANGILAPYGRKIGPDPASINAAMIGGIAANNASGMCCGTAQNSYRTVDSIRIVLADGTVLDTGDEHSRAAFASTHGPMLARLDELARRVRADVPLADRIRSKFKIKNTTGYSLNALVDYSDPFDIITHLMIGSEGTLAFISHIVYRTVAAPPFKATALMMFPKIDDACRTARRMQDLPVVAAELMDRASLRSVEGKTGMPAMIQGVSPTTTALLVETQAADFATLSAHVREIADTLEMPMSTRSVPGGRTHEWQLAGAGMDVPAVFTDDAGRSDSLWRVRKGLLPSAGAVRRLGTTVLIEDVAFPIHSLAPATLDLQALFGRHGYREAIIFGHALAGNLHFVFSPDFGIPAEVDRYARFMDDIARMVVDVYDGSLKAEHGTGRNMAPYVEKEWGSQAYGLMGEIKTLFDPRGLLNPGVILNPNPRVHLENLKPLPPADPLIDACMECGFCECHCPSRNLSLTPRQRIVVQREIARLTASGDDDARLAELKKGYGWQGEATCAADGLCGVSCPVDVDTGKFTKTFRSRQVKGQPYQWLADRAADHFGPLTAGIRTGLSAADRLHRRIGSEAMGRLTGVLRRLSGNRLPAWLPSLPTAAAPPRGRSAGRGDRAVVYFPACVSRTMGPDPGDPLDAPLHEVTERVLRRAGYRVVYPERMDGLCCGLPFESKGFFAQADRKSRSLEAALLRASDNGRLPVLCDTSPCLERMRRTFGPRLTLFEPVEFTACHLLDRLTITRTEDPIALHITCSARKMGLDKAFMTVAEACAETVVVPYGIECCGFAGDRGFNVPELNSAALAGLKKAVAGCTAGYANSRTCEIGLSHHSGIPYRSIMVLVDRCSRG
ncbi:oxidoreductase [Desulfosarcina alkanivorans]|uniref:D-lactate dehydrogenase (cytochrome) n=1 Tax=Desulfosarcina alkanivorans TaxID=571177 RepID=A0A5K7YI50_9BACT|nr:FAD-binding and (Fe-S)-binding domain-containing protein [Desulfosarcina alkanivorans]BBO67770.1 oxidoreductase [Desulfosarcina alkanivorans]